MSDVLPPSSLGPHSSRCLLSNGFVPRSPFTAATSRHSRGLGSPLRPLGRRPRRLRVLSFHQCVAQTFTACGPSVTDLDGCKQTLPAMASGGGDGGGSSGGLGQLLGAINTLLPALHPLFPPPSDHGGGHRTRRFRRAARWLWLPGCLSFEVLCISIYVNSILMLKKNVTGYIIIEPRQGKCRLITS